MSLEPVHQWQKKKKTTQKTKTEYKNNHNKTHCYIRNLKSNQEYHGPHSGPLK